MCSSVSSDSSVLAVPTVPTVFSVGNTYQILQKTEKSTTFWVRVGDRTFYDHSNGILRSDTDIHRVCVPSALLDAEKSYTVCTRKILERKPYFSVTDEVVETTYSFCPPQGDTFRAYHIADAHNHIDEPVRAAKAFGKIDCLILNGDIPDHSGTTENFDNIYAICAQITEGKIPVIFARGNHDLRGVCAEKIADYTPNRNGRSYYTVRLGGFWALVLDCAEDKPDTHEEYGNTVCCHAFREEETDYIKDVIRNKASEYEADGVIWRAVICHSPFTRKYKPPFDIENEIYDSWVDLLNREIRPNALLCGHIHEISLDLPGEKNDARGAKFPVAVLSQTDYQGYFVGAGLSFSKNDGITVTVTDSNGEVKERFRIG